ncbi:hypothetical protein KI688_005819 [Linnemannia hyalina]|uniref:Uncharacterized protein n=1 Tax=Linnemannia hyalina TaxID=64524 RepID=A0A9P8BXU5_9FUNG|nr:hypothetical protein KI688_005819 [Linnemannia hyalina]
MSATKMDAGCFKAALLIVNVTLRDRINHTAQISLANDIHEYLSESEQGLHHVFINVDYLLPQPEILPGRRYEPLDNYLKKHLIPDLEMRIRCWDQAELRFLPLPVPDHTNDGDTATTTATVDTTPATSELTPCTATTATDDDTGLGLSMVTLSGWLLGYPVNYVLPTTASMKARKRAARALKLQERALLRQQRLAAKLLRHHEQQQQYPQQQQEQGMGEDQVLLTATVRHDSTDCGTCVDDGNMSDDEGGQRGQSPIEEEYEDEEEEDSSHNSLANRLLVLTQVNLTANEDIHGLNDCCLFSFSYPSVILDRRSLATMGTKIPSPGGQLPTAPASPLRLTANTADSPAADTPSIPHPTAAAATTLPLRPTITALKVIPPMHEIEIAAEVIVEAEAEAKVDIETLL